VVKRETNAWRRRASAFEQRCHLGFFLMVHAQRDRASARRVYVLRRFLEGFGPVVGRRPAAHAAAGAINNRSGRAQRSRNPTARSARRAGHHGDGACEPKRVSGTAHLRAPAASAAAAASLCLACQGGPIDRPMARRKASTSLPLSAAAAS
jgi:hypothetical protein